MNSITLDAFQTFHHGWALVTAGTADDFNTMTVSWGGLGSLWNRSVATIYVRPSRYTYEFLERYDQFTISFYPESFRKALGILGRESGRDGNKVASAGLTPVPFGNSMTFEEASATILCQKIYFQDMRLDQIPEDIRQQFYPAGETVHRLYIGEVLNIQQISQEEHHEA